MKEVNVKQIIADKKLDANEIAKQLFPGNKFPRLALNRVMSGGAYLDSMQLSKLAHIIGVSIDSLYNRGSWKPSHKNRQVIFTNGRYKAILDVDTSITRIYDNDSLIHDSVIHTGATPLNEYLELINKIIL
jgi:hypothetical protein